MSINDGVVRLDRWLARAVIAVGVLVLGGVGGLLAVHGGSSHTPTVHVAQAASQSPTSTTAPPSSTTTAPPVSTTTTSLPSVGATSPTTSPTTAPASGGTTQTTQAPTSTTTTTTTVPMVTVPNVIGMTPQQAFAAMAQVGLSGVEGCSGNGISPVDQQAIPAGTQLPRGAAVMFCDSL